MESIVSTLQKLGAARIAAMVVVSALLISFFAFITVRVSKPPAAPLYTDLSFDDSAAIIEFLESQGIEYELSNNGGSISIAQDQILRTRMALAGEGLPLGGSVGYEIFDKTDTLGTTSFVQNINRVRALEGELSRTITSINRILAARVHLVIPERQLFQREQKPPTASIVVKVRSFLDPSQIRAIQHLVASAIDGLSPNKVSIVDEAGTLLASGNEPNGAGLAMLNAQNRATQIQDHLRGQITDLLTGVVGPGRARVQVTAELEMNRVTQTSDVYDPESQVVRSTQNRAQESESQERRSNAGVSVGNELPAATADARAPDETEATTNTEEVVNYEISRTTTTQVQEAGAVKRLSVAVLVDGTYTQNEDGNLVYQPRSEEELERLSTLVRSAVGFNEERGDRVEVINLEFAEKPVINTDFVEEESVFEFTKYDYFRMVELAVMAVLTLLVLLLVVRPLLRRVLDNSAPEALAPELITSAGEAGQSDGAITANTAANASMTGAKGRLSPNMLTNHPATQQIAEAMQNGAVRAEVVAQIGDMVNESPDAAVDVIRDLLKEAA